MLNKFDLLTLICTYANACSFAALKTGNGVSHSSETESSYQAIKKTLDEIYDVNKKLVERLNAYHSDTLALIDNPDAIYQWDSQLTIDNNNEVYKLLGIDAPIQDI